MTTATRPTVPVVLVTGALAGIGRATALVLARQGARVVVSGRNQEAGDALAAELRTLGAEALFLRADVRNDAELRSLVDQTVERFGRLDAAINNAGTEGQPGPIVEQSAETYAATFDTNVLGVLLSMKHELRVMQAQGAGSIVNVSSAYGKIGAAGASVYVASKHAVEGLTKSAALEVATTGIRVNAVAPGPIQTDMIERFTGGEAGKTWLTEQVPAKRLGRAEEVAELIAYVAIGKASYITGQSLSIDGGITA
jgi:NAD(P)-dependent dehydrogenase (short-subunit alcohol dehydrogenase family)